MASNVPIISSATLTPSHVYVGEPVLISVLVNESISPPKPEESDTDMLITVSCFDDFDGNWLVSVTYPDGTVTSDSCMSGSSVVFKVRQYGEYKVEGSGKMGEYLTETVTFTKGGLTEFHVDFYGEGTEPSTTKLVINIIFQGTNARSLDVELPNGEFEGIEDPDPNGMSSTTFENTQYGIYKLTARFLDGTSMQKQVEFVKGGATSIDVEFLKEPDVSETDLIIHVIFRGVFPLAFYVTRPDGVRESQSILGSSFNIMYRQYGTYQLSAGYSDGTVLNNQATFVKGGDTVATVEFYGQGS